MISDLNTISIDPYKELVDALYDYNNVEFVYTKVNGEKRIAHGTLKHSVLEANNVISNGDKKWHDYPDDKLRYYDVDKNAWRSCKKDLIDDYYKIIN